MDIAGPSSMQSFSRKNLIMAELFVEIFVTQWPKIECLVFHSFSSHEESKHIFLYAIFSCQNLWQKIAQNK